MTDWVSWTMTTNLDALLNRIRGEFEEMPGLRITATQAQRLWDLPGDVCQAALERLADEQFLRQAADGAFVRNRPHP